MRREIAGWLLVLLALAALGLFVWVSRRPADPRLDRVAALPVIGAAIDRLRGRYLPPPPRSVRERERDTAAGPAGPLAADPTEWVFVGIGAALRAAPRSEAPLLRRTLRLDQYPVLERAPPWVRVALRDGGEAWVDLEAPRDRTPPLGEAPAPPGPLPARAPAPDVLALASGLLSEPHTERVLAGYLVRTDVDDPALLARLGERLETLERVYAQRYGVVPIGRPAEALVVFVREEGYRRFESRLPELRGVGTTGHASDGVAALFVGERRQREVLATAVHEVTHLLNRRALGPALPAWLEEGLADEMALLGLARADGGGSPYTGFLEVDGAVVRGSGPLAGLAQLLDRLEAGALVPLDEMVGQDWQDFRAGPRGRDLYNQSGFFLHYLLERDGPHPLAEGFRSFLAAVARGEPLTGDALIASLGVGWAALELDFRVWLLAEGARAGADLVRGRTPAVAPAGAGDDRRRSPGQVGALG
ncbi:MAG TPA: SH3 domain-containing protein [Thermoanaerobaculia bacterium]|nr:SH3 domain-containing protein [Thermoanaerobaculia bacterium]